MSHLIHKVQVFVLMCLIFLLSVISCNYIVTSCELSLVPIVTIFMLIHVCLSNSKFCHSHDCFICNASKIFHNTGTVLNKTIMNNHDIGMTCNNFPWQWQGVAMSRFVTNYYDLPQLHMNGHELSQHLHNMSQQCYDIWRSVESVRSTPFSNILKLAPWWKWDYLGCELLWLFRTSPDYVYDTPKTFLWPVIGMNWCKNREGGTGALENILGTEIGYK